MLTVKKAKAIYAIHSIELDDVDAALVAHNCNNKAEDSSKSAEDWANLWAAAENFADLETTYEGASRGH